MKHETPTIAAQIRERTGSRYAARIRKAGRLPAVIYGHKSNPVAISVDEKEITVLMQHGAHVMDINIEGAATETCLVKDLQFGFLGDNVIHVDFARVDLEEEVSVRVHLAFAGTPEAATHAGAILEHDHTELTVKCKVAAIPEAIKVDLSKMEGQQLQAGDIELPPGLLLADDPITLIASVSYLRKEEEAVVGEEAEVDAEAEPEVITEAKGETAEAEVESE